MVLPVEGTGHASFSPQPIMHCVVDWARLESEALIVITLSGTADPERLQALMDEVEAATMLGPVRILVDETCLEPGLVTANDIRSMAKCWRQTEWLSRSRIAVIAGSEVIFGLNRMFHLNAGVDGTFRVCRTHDEALEWLGASRPWSRG